MYGAKKNISKQNSIYSICPTLFYGRKEILGREMLILPYTYDNFNSTWATTVITEKINNKEWIYTPKAHLAQTHHHHSLYIFKIHLYKCWRNYFRTSTKQKTLTLPNYGTRYPNIAFFGVLEPPSLSNKKIWKFD